MSSQRSYPYAVSRIKASESSLIDLNTWTRLQEADIKEAYRLLHDIGYGQGAPDPDDIDSLTAESVAQARGLINEITPDEAITNLFLLQVDGHNIKTILKGMLQREEVDNILLTGGSIPLEALKQAFENDVFDTFPVMLRRAVEDFDPNTPPNILSAQIDNAVYRQIEYVLSNKKTHNDLAERYFKSRIDFTNVLTILRAHHLGWDAGQTAPMIVPGGELASTALLAALGSDESQLPDELASGKYSTQIRDSVAGYLNSGNIFVVENRFYKISYEIVHEEYTDSFGIGPILNYLLQKEFEARTLRVMFASKRSGREISLQELGVLS